MTGGFGAVPEELYRTANQIGDVIGSASGLLWQGPSGDYGHPGVQTGWGSFIDDVKSEVESSIAELKKTLEGTDTEAIRTATESAAQVSQKMGTAIYAQSQAANAAGAQGGAEGTSDTPGDDDVVEAEIVEDEKPGAEGGAA